MNSKMTPSDVLPAKKAKMDFDVNIIEIFMRFPHIGDRIFEKLDNQSLTKFRLVCKSWTNFVDDQRKFWVRRIQAKIFMSHSSITKVLLKKPLEFLKEVDDCSRFWNYMKTEYTEEVMSHQIFHVLTYCNQGYGKFLWQLMFDNITNKNPIDPIIGYTVLHIIAQSFPREIEKFRMIIEQVEDKNPKVNLDHTPLHFAAKRGYIEICKLILEHVTDKSPRNHFGDTPFSLAKESGHAEICKMITESLTQKEGP